MRYLISGASGFLGSNLQKKFYEAGLPFLAISYDTILKLEKKRSEIDSEILRIMEFRPTIFINLAWNVNPVNWRNTGSQKDLVQNIQILIRLLSQGGLEKVISAGTCLEYLPSTKKLDESSALSHDFEYIKDKHILHAMTRDNAKTLNFEHVWVRIFNMYGEGDHPSRLISRLLKNPSEFGKVELNSPQVGIDYVHVLDVVEAIHLLANMDRPVPKIVNVASSKLISPRKLQECLLGGGHLTNGDLEILSRDIRLPCYWGDIALISELGWLPSRNFAESINKMAQL